VAATDDERGNREDVADHRQQHCQRVEDDHQRTLLEIRQSVAEAYIEDKSCTERSMKYAAFEHFSDHPSDF